MTIGSFRQYSHLQLWVVLHKALDNTTIPANLCGKACSHGLLGCIGLDRSLLHRNILRWSLYLRSHSLLLGPDH